MNTGSSRRLLFSVLLGSQVLLEVIYISTCWLLGLLVGAVISLIVAGSGIVLIIVIVIIAGVLLVRVVGGLRIIVLLVILVVLVVLLVLIVVVAALVVVVVVRVVHWLLLLCWHRIFQEVGNLHFFLLRRGDGGRFGHGRRGRLCRRRGRLGSSRLRIIIIVEVLNRLAGSSPSAHSGLCFVLSNVQVGSHSLGRLRDNFSLLLSEVGLEVFVKVANGLGWRRRSWREDRWSHCWGFLLLCLQVTIEVIVLRRSRSWLLPRGLLLLANESKVEGFLEIGYRGSLLVVHHRGHPISWGFGALGVNWRSG
mmetsp:Transcript_32991/g.50496  ORF Transcript_32991/g.50496 Transcript_32991/m.50496 type:complete len:308 (+) Transcript_32991:692-1615(+)